MPCLSILNPTPHIPPSHILHPASHTPCLPIPYPTSLHPTPPLCLLMGCCTQGTHQFSVPVPKPSSSSQPSSSSSSGSKGVISAGRAGSGVQRLAARREPQTTSSLLPLPRASSSSSLRTCTSVWKGRKYHLVGRGGKPALCPELGEGRKPRVAEGAPPGLWIFQKNPAGRMWGRAHGPPGRGHRRWSRSSSRAPAVTPGPVLAAGPPSPAPGRSRTARCSPRCGAGLHQAGAGQRCPHPTVPQYLSNTDADAGAGSSATANSTFFSVSLMTAEKGSSCHCSARRLGVGGSVELTLCAVRSIPSTGLPCWHLG